MEDRATNIRQTQGHTEPDWCLLDQMTMPIALVSGDLCVERSNPAFDALLGLDSARITGRSCRDLFPEQGGDALASLCRDAGKTDSVQVMLPSADGFQCLSAFVLPLGDEFLLQFQNVTSELRYQKQNQRREEQDALLFAILQKLLALPIRKIDAGIDYALAELGAFLNVDRCYLFKYDSEANTINNSHEWVSGHCQPQISSLQDLSVESFRWFWSFMAAGRSMIVGDVSDLPEEAAVEQAHWQEQSIQSLLVIPLQVEGALHGFLGVDRVQNKHSWLKPELQLLEMVGEFLCSIVERRSSSLARETSDKRFSALADAAPALIWEMNAEGEISYGNRSWQEFTGAGEGLQKSNDFIHPDELSRFRSKCDLCLEKMKIVTMEVRLKRADGEHRWMQVTAAPLQGPDRDPGMIVSAFDVTDHKMAEEQLLTMNEDLEMRVVERTSELEEKNNQLHTLTRAIEQSPTSIVITDLAGNIEYVNPKFTEVTGYTPDEAIGQNPRVLKGEDGHTDYELMWETLTAGHEWRGEFHNRKKCGEYFWEMASISPVTDSDGQVRHFLAVKEDITGRKELEQTILIERDDLKEAQAELQQAYDELKSTQSHLLQQEKMASIGQLAAGVAHEINNPVGFIKSNLATLGKYVGRLKEFIDLQRETLTSELPADKLEPVNEAARKFKIDYLFEDIPDLVEESIDGAERVKTIVQNLKSFSRVDQTQYSETDLNECLESTINMVWNELKYKVTLNRDLGELPRVKCYPQQLNQVFMNILVNGSQAIEQQGEMSVKTRVEGKTAVISISDNGCGIPPENLRRIFEPFFTTKDVGKGTGLGMSISYDIIKKHGGELMVESVVGQGTTFKIILPLKGAPPPAENREEPDTH